MTIGINSFVDSIFIAVGLGVVATALIIPIFEEVFKGTGLLIFSLHHEYDSVADGLVFGFTVGMGFAFIENWLYFIQNPMGADISAWVILFFMRSIMFSAMHGVYTSMTGGIIGFMRSRSMPAVLLFPIAVLPAIIFHAIHNSGELLMSIFGLGGLEAHCCIIMPLFDYGGLLLVALAMLAWTIMQRKKEKRKFRLKDKSRRDVQVRTE
jgi:RsiW-degrading membrane proteinase PrsW (M82 family)